jgi:hypothetical protein
MSHFPDISSHILPLQMFTARKFSSLQVFYQEVCTFCAPQQAMYVEHYMPFVLSTQILTSFSLAWHSNNVKNVITSFGITGDLRNHLLLSG